ncbi:YbaB/EbfC family nucleoid-associated protein [Pseudonocardia hispaniensis]|uniref:YbaB/EbfC family nucleoid-associated protein n=1 Tax=Pseudonocardia hispaniensis TaxID=904933 RepID=A0ABW1J5R1_9PSEU
MDAHEWLSGYRRRTDDIARRAVQAQADLAAVRGSARSPDGAVTVTVNSAGALQGLTLGRAAEGQSRVQLAEAVLATARRAHAEATQQAIAVITPLIGESSEAMRVVRSALTESSPGDAR